MSRLPNAPLLEVVFELRWELNNEEEKNNYQYLHGDLYTSIRGKYPVRELVVPAHFPVDVYLHQVAHRFRRAPGDYPLVQIGPGILTVNTDDENYVWEEYQGRVNSVVDSLINLESYNKATKVNLALKYFDFLPFDFDEKDIKDYLSENLHIKIEQDFYKNDKPPYNINLAFSYGTNVGTLNVGINRGQISANGREGIIIQIEVAKPGLQSDSKTVERWLNDAHEITRATFVEMTKGNLQEAFNN